MNNHKRLYIGLLFASLTVIGLFCGGCIRLGPVSWHNYWVGKYLCIRVYSGRYRGHSHGGDHNQGQKHPLI